MQRAVLAGAGARTAMAVVVLVCAGALGGACAGPYRILLHDPVGEPTALCEVPSDYDDPRGACGCGAEEEERCVAMRPPLPGVRIVTLDFATPDPGPN